MWVYQEQTVDKTQEEKATLPEEKEKPVPVEAAEKTPEKPDRAAGRARHAGGQATRDCLWLAAAYLFGTLTAGALQAVCDEGEQEALRYFLNCWCRLFQPNGAGGAAALFGAEYLAAAGAGTLLLLLGLSALGPTFLFLFMMLYGTGAGLLTAQLFSGLTPAVFAACVGAAGVPLAVIAGALCVFGASAMQVCTRLQAYSFSSRGALTAGAGARGLVGQYFLLAAFLAPVCGAATGLACLAQRAGIW